ncbi:MAG TPA: tetratricopeptide repeat protein [Puia sp.]|nr:tetratricopeptide repeat protein [Puia sp.]
MPNYDTEYIIQYLSNELSETERADFEAELVRDPELAATTEHYREMLGVLAGRLDPDPGAQALEKTLIQMRDRYFGGATGPTRGVVRSMRRVASGIAAALLLVAGGFWLFRHNGSAIDELGRTEMVTSVERGGHSDSVLERAAECFNAEKFADALPLLNEAVRSDSSSELARFYRGVTLWRLKRLPAARTDLTQVYTSGSVLQYEAAFYIALSYAQEKDTGKAVDWLHRIPDDAPVSLKAKKLHQLIAPAP